MTSSRTDLRIAAAFCAGIGAYDTLYVLLVLAGGPLIGPPVHAFFADFLVFQSAILAWMQDKAVLIYDISGFTHFQNALYSARFGGQADFRPFFYPPVWLLMLLPLAWVSVNKALVLFLATTAALATRLAGIRDRWGWLAVVTSPAAVWVLISGQNTFLTVALFYGGLRLLDRRPVAAGILLGLLIYKPQLWALVPIALLASRQWRALAWMTATVGALSLASLAVFGPDLWRAFMASTHEGTGRHIANEMFDHFRTQIVTPFAAARIVGLPAGIADAAQLGSALIAIGATWLAFRRHRSCEPRIALLAAATFLVSPYVMNYDLLLLMPAVVSMFRLGVARGFRPMERPIHLALWLMPTFGMYGNLFGLPVMPAFILLFGCIVWTRLQSPSVAALPIESATGWASE
jgi:hypothetical protein